MILPCTFFEIYKKVGWFFFWDVKKIEDVGEIDSINNKYYVFLYRFLHNGFYAFYMVWYWMWGKFYKGGHFFRIYFNNYWGFFCLFLKMAHGPVWLTFFLWIFFIFIKLVCRAHQLIPVEPLECIVCAILTHIYSFTIWNPVFV